MIRRGQKEGGILADRDAEAEAWIFLSLGLLATVSGAWAGSSADDFDRIMAPAARG